MSVLQPDSLSDPVKAVQRQIVLPLSKAVEIAYKSIRMRLSRSLLVTSGIVLALAFLMSILVADQMTTGMRNWGAGFESSSEYQQISAQRETLLNDQLKPLDAQLHQAAGVKESAKGLPPFDAVGAFGSSLVDLQKQIGMPLPATAVDLTRAFTLHAELVGTMKQWIETARRAQDLRERMIAPQKLQQMMKNAGVPSTAAEIASNKIQTRWLLGLALLVAFVGILNAMLMSVTERFREIGTMKCLGALDSFIIKLFLIESLFQGGVGTVVGVVAGTVLSMLSMTGTYGRYAWKSVPWGGIGLSGLICLAVGMGLTVAGALYPAWQAARMQPIEAMRSET